MNHVDLATVFGLGVPEFILIGFFFGWLAFWIWMLADCANNEPAGATRNIWFFVILLAPPIGAPCYLVSRLVPRIPKGA
jgi:hypothetical protein